MYIRSYYNDNADEIYVIGERIHELRKKLGFSQELFAKKLREKVDFKIDRTLISKWENGRHHPSPEIIIAMASIFNIPVENLTGEDTLDEDLNSLNAKPFNPHITLSEGQAGFRERDLIISFRGLTQEQKDIVFKLVESMYAISEELYKKHN